MARRLGRTAGRLGIDDDGQALIRSAFDIGMRKRRARPLDDHHPDYLHPSRTALILMDDARVSAVTVLAAALVVETRDAELAPSAGEVAGLGAEIAAVAAAVPDPGREGERLLEALLVAPLDARLVALAERLDHARHLHLRDRGEWTAYHATTCSVYTPVAQRTEIALAGRLAWWCTTFERRFLQK